MKPALYLIAISLCIAPALAVQVEGNRLILSPDEVEQCAAEGGCGLITRMALEAALKKAAEQASKQCGMRT